MKIGIDIGNVIIGGGGEDTFFTDAFLETPEVKSAFFSIWTLISKGHSVYLISKCGETVEEKTLKWLDHEAFFVVTCVNPRDVYFVRHRMDKAPVARALLLDVFIDDRQDIIDSMEGTVPYSILFTSWEQTNVELERVFADVAER